ncbi:putative Major facilitator superfamily (MFS) profile domain-containing protein [Seiridium cardinale]|uniref:Major facilitator superfamily (MFS) profile domain-containing protein n=1 Tax=Seiridium cardinale TaxID=138064 RepID=A0ABR2XXJ7_9PEZI
MADEITRAGPTNGLGGKEDVETLERQPYDRSQQFANARAMDSQHRARVEKSLKRKLDARCSLFIFLYIMNYLDRNNIAAARLKGLQSDLRLDNTQYSTCLSILYVGYILMQVPSNILINRISRPSIYIGCAMLVWGVVSTLSGITTNFTGMVLTRFFLGFIEAAFLPGALMILSKWYTRRELTTRNAVLFCGNLISNAFSALIGAGVLSNMQGVLGHAAWRWLFWIEGAITMAFAISSAFILPDLPHNSRGFTAEELEVAQLRMLEDVGEADEDSAGQGVFAGFNMAIKDVKIYVMSITFTAYVVGLSFNAFFPTLTGTLGFDYVPTLLMSAPPWVFSCIMSLINAWHADRTGEKFWHIVGPICVGLVGFIISMSTLNTAARYVALFLQASSYAGFIVFYSWISSTFPRPPAKRAVAIAFINAFSQLGNVAGSYVWNLSDNGYRKSYGIVLSMFGVTILGCFMIRMMLIRLNKQLEQGETAWETQPDVAQHTAEMENMDSPEEAHKMVKGFRYLWNDIIAGLALLHVCSADRTYRSRPDLAPPHLSITVATSSQVEQGYLFIAPYSGKFQGTPQSGPYIVDNSGDLVWSGYGDFGPTTANFQPARWNGQDVLFGYEGTLNPLKGHGHGHHKIVDQHYQTIHEVRSAGHYLSDMHEFNVVNEKTVLVGSYTPREIDLSPYGGDENQTWIIEYILQELDIGTGEILFEWHSLDHTSPQESTLPLGSQAGSGDNSSTAWDYLHVNSITKGEDGHYLISARSASTLYKLNGTDGSVIWRLGGKSSDFALGLGVEFAFQHHARYFFGVLDTISFFDNSAGAGSAGKIITLDFDKWTATLKQGFYPPHPIFALSQGSTQILPNGNALVNWGSADQITEFNSKGDVLFHAYLESGMRQQYTQNYRAFRGNWTGISPETPAVATEQGEDGKMTVWVSWNGDTSTAVWRIWWSTALNLKSQDVPRQGFETRYEILGDAQVHNVYVEALDKEGKVLAVACMRMPKKAVTNNLPNAWLQHKLRKRLVHLRMRGWSKAQALGENVPREELDIFLTAAVTKHSQD